MKKAFILLILAVAASASTAQAQNLYVGEYNILADSGVFFDSYETADVRFAETGSMNHFKPNYKTDLRIDHVFLSPHFKALDYALLTYSYWTEVEPNVYEQRLPSDHYPVGVHVEFINSRNIKE